MKIRDKVVSWFIKNVIIPANEVLDKPGFIVTRFADKQGRVFFRELFLPETLFANLESDVINIFGEGGKQSLYSIGKKFGYRYASISHLPTIRIGKEEFTKFGVFFARYVESTWAEKLEYDFDYDRRKVEFDFQEYAVCRLTGGGQLFTEGAIAGLWAWLIEDVSAEAYQSQCQGRGDKKCHVIVAPKKYFDKAKISCVQETNLEQIKVSEQYILFNSIRPTENSKISLKELIDTKKVSYSEGKMIFKSQRHFIIEASIIYFIENANLSNKYKELLFNSSFNYGRSLMQHNDRQPEKFVSDYLGASGWGDVEVIKENKKFLVNCRFFPWLELGKESEFIIIRGIISGILSSSEKRNVVLNKYSAFLENNFFAVQLKEG